MQKDLLTGGPGKDIFKYVTIKDSGTTAATRDVITDFKHGTDKIDLGAIDAIRGTAKNDAFHFLGQQTLDLVNPSKAALTYKLVDNPGTKHDVTIVSVDVNGDHKADMQIALDHLIKLTKADFIL